MTAQMPAAIFLESVPSLGLCLKSQHEFEGRLFQNVATSFPRLMSTMTIPSFLWDVERAF